VRSLRAINGTLYFAGDDGTDGIELWKSNGTGPGTVMVKDLRVVSRLNDVSSRPDGFVALGNWVIFYADDGVTGRELWRSDGTAAGTILLKDIYPNQYSDSSYNGSNPSPYVSLGGYVYFYAADVDHGGELWRTDGTPEGTTLVKDIRPGPASSIPRWMQLVGGRIYFQADDGATGVEMWTTDGTEAGTIRVADINPGAGGSTPTRFFDVNGAVVILASDGTHPPSLFRFEPEAVKPTVVGAQFTRVGGKAAVVVDFTEDVSGSLAVADLVVMNLTTGQALDPAAFTLTYDAGNNRATFTLGGGVLGDGTYRATLAAGAVRDASDNPLAADGTLDFFVLAGDANGDRVVNFNDLLVLARNYNTAGAGWADGDFNGDGVVNFNDLLMLARNYNKTLEVPPAPAPVMASAAALPKAPKRQGRSVKPVFATRPASLRELGTRGR
jgi:ELWxxDGT repeat protein